MDEAVAALIVLTDGFGPAPESASQIPTLWALTSDGQKPAPWGETIHLPDFNRGLDWTKLKPVPIAADLRIITRCYEGPLLNVVARGKS